MEVLAGAWRLPRRRGWGRGKPVCLPRDDGVVEIMGIVEVREGWRDRTVREVVVGMQLLVDADWQV